MDQQYKDRLAIARQRNLEEAIRLTGLYSDAAKHVDEPPLITDAERAALNIKFEYERAKKLNAMHAEAQRLAMEAPTPAYIVRGEFHAGAKLRALIDAQNAMLQETANDIRAQHNPQLDWYRDPMVTMVTPEEPRSSILKLALNITLRIVLVIAVAVAVLAVVS